MNEEARRAISSIEAVLNNRFIRVYWHREPGTNPTGLQQPEQSSGSQLPGLTPSQGPQHGNMHKVSEESSNILKPLVFLFLKPFIQLKRFNLMFYQQGIKQHCPAAYVLNKTVPKHRLAAAAGATAGTRPDCLNPNTDAAYVGFSLYARACLCVCDCVG